MSHRDRGDPQRGNFSGESKFECPARLGWPNCLGNRDAVSPSSYVGQRSTSLTLKALVRALITDLKCNPHSSFPEVGPSSTRNHRQRRHSSETLRKRTDNRSRLGLFYVGKRSQSQHRSRFHAAKQGEKVLTMNCRKRRAKK